MARRRITSGNAISLVLLALFVQLVGCAPGDRIIAGVGGSDAITQVHIGNLLASRGIECYFEGSIGYGLFVPSRDAARATAILKADRAMRPYIYIHGEPSPPRPNLDDPASIKSHPNIAYEQFLQTDAGREGTDLGGVLRQADVKKAAQSCRYLESVASLERRYIGSQGTIEIGHEIRVRLVDSLTQYVHDEEFFYQAWNNATEFAYTGSRGGWRTGDCDCTTTAPATRP